MVLLENLGMFCAADFIANKACLSKCFSKKFAIKMPLYYRIALT